MAARFSIVIPVYNVAKYLRECLESVCAAAKEMERAVGVGERTGSSLVEVICVDDGSTDGSDAILDEYARRATSFNLLTFKVIHQKNAGVSAARNAGLAVATGDYVCFLDPDDWLSPAWLENFAEVINRSSPDLVLAGYRTFEDGESVALEKYPPTEPAEAWNGKDARKRLLCHFLTDGRSFVFAVRRSLLKGAVFPVGVRLAEDMIFCLQVADRVRSVVRTHYLGHRYRQHAASLVKVGLASAERVRFLRAFATFKDQLRGVDPSLAVWQMVQFWLVNAADYDEAIAIRDELNRIAALGLLRLSSLPVPSRPGAWLFLRVPTHPKLVRFVHCSAYKIYHLLGGKRW